MGASRLGSAYDHGKFKLSYFFYENLVVKGILININTPPNTVIVLVDWYNTN